MVTLVIRILFQLHLACERLSQASQINHIFRRRERQQRLETEAKLSRMVGLACQRFRERACIMP
jgi:hypothetical protein